LPGFPAEADLLPGTADQVPHHTAQHGAREHDPDEPRVAVAEHVVDGRALRVLHDEHDQDHDDEERHGQLGDAGLARSLLGAVMVEERIAAARGRFGGLALPAHRPPRGPGGSAIVAQWGRPAAYAGVAMAIGLLSST